MNAIEEKAREYARDAFSRMFSDRDKPWNEVEEIITEVYLSGAKEAIASQWRNVEEAARSDNQRVGGENAGWTTRITPNKTGTKRWRLVDRFVSR